MSVYVQDGNVLFNLCKVFENDSNILHYHAYYKYPNV